MVYRKKSTHIPSGLIVSVLIFLELLVVIGGWKYKDNLMSSSTLSISKQPILIRLGSVMYTDYILYFQLAGIVLLLAMIGAIFLLSEKELVLKNKAISIKFREIHPRL